MKRERRPSTAPVASAPAPISRRERLLWAGILLAAYGCLGTWGQFDFSDLWHYYNLLADAFMEGRVSIAITPQQSALPDMIPFEGRYYLQWGPFPAVLHLIPRILGLRLSDRLAVILAGWLSALVFFEIILRLRQRYFSDVSLWICRWFFLAFAFGTPNCTVTLQASVYHESIAMAALGILAGFYAVFRYAESRSSRWLLLAGIAVALALSARVSYVLYGISMLAGILVLAHRSDRLRHAALFCIPLLAAGLLMMAYNQARFHSPWEYGLRYLPEARPEQRAYAVGRIPENFRNYLLAPIRFSKDPPWIRHVGWPPFVQTRPAEDVSSVFLMSPFLLLGALVWKHFRTGDILPRPLRICAATIGGSATLQFASLLSFDAARRRYMHDFVPALMILAFVGAAGFLREDAWRRWSAPAWVTLTLSALLHLHLAFFQFTVIADPNLMKAFVLLSPVVRSVAPSVKLDEHEAVTRNDLGVWYLRRRRRAEAIRQFETAAQLMPHSDIIRKNLEIARGFGANR